jgi:hypothetical protein
MDVRISSPRVGGARGDERTVHFVIAFSKEATMTRTQRSIHSPARLAITAAIGTLAFTSVASATLTSPLWSRPANDAAATANHSTYQLFDVFGDDDFAAAGVQDLAPDIGANPSGVASVEETAGAFVTGTGNLYSPFVVLDMKVNIPGYAPTPAASTRFLLQFETLGSELVKTESGTNNFSAFKVNGAPIQGLRDFSYTELSRTASMGATVEHAFTFTLPTTATAYQITYQPLGTSCSQSLISIDTFIAIPGDFDYDGDRDAADVDLLLRTTAGPTPPANSLFDVDLDGKVVLTRNTAGSDLDAWVHGLESTEYGDANLDGAINFQDLVTLAQHYGQSTGSWAIGDFDGNNDIGFSDLVTLAQNYGFGTAGTLTSTDFASDWALAQSLVPEPTTLSLAVVAGTFLVRRRRIG